MQINMGQCPFCKTVATRLLLEPVELAYGPLGMTGSYHGVSYHCFSCNAVLGVQMDPIALTDDIANAVAQRLGRG